MSKAMKVEFPYKLTSYPEHVSAAQVVITSPLVLKVFKPSNATALATYLNNKYFDYFVRSDSIMKKM